MVNPELCLVRLKIIITKKKEFTWLNSNKLMNKLNLVKI